MVHDLNVPLCYADRAGRMTDAPQRRTLHVVDGVIGGERDVPLHSTAHPAGTIVAGTNLLVVDLVASTAMGFDPARVPVLRDAWRVTSAWALPPEGACPADVRVRFRMGGAAEDVDLVGLGARLTLRFATPIG